MKQPSDGIDTIYQSNQPDMNNFVFISYSSESVTEKLYPGQKTPPPTTVPAFVTGRTKGLTASHSVSSSLKGRRFYFLGGLSPGYKNTKFTIVSF